MTQQDILMRAIEQLAAMVARAFGLVSSRQYEAALDAVQEGKGALPIVPGMVDQLEPEALFQLLGSDHSTTLASLWRAEAKALEGLNHRTRAERAQARAQRLEQRIAARAPRTDENIPINRPGSK